MSTETDFENHDDLFFFGRVNASISHELKNCMAIISETAGLLQDLTAMAAKGEKLEFEMLATCSVDIIEEIQRGFAIIKQMNVFSHSVDETVKEINVLDVLERVVALSKFLSTASGICFDPPPENAATVTTNPFRFQNLVYRALIFAFESVGPDGRVAIGLQSNPNGGACVTFSGLGANRRRPFAADKTKSLAATIGIDIRETRAADGFELVVPENINSE